MRVTDFAACKRWYVEKLNFRVVHQWSSKDLQLAYLAPATDDSFFVEIIGGGSPTPKAGYSDLDSSLQSSSFHHFCLAVENVTTTLAELRRRGVKVVKEPFEVEAISRRLAFIADPWGNMIEFAQTLR